MGTEAFKVLAESWGVVNFVLSVGVFWKGWDENIVLVTVVIASVIPVFTNDVEDFIAFDVVPSTVVVLLDAVFIAAVIIWFVRFIPKTAFSNFSVVRSPNPAG